MITQNVDGLHARAGSKSLVELHGNLYKTRCTKCKEVLVNTDSPICEVRKTIYFYLSLHNLKSGIKQLFIPNEYDYVSHYWSSVKHSSSEDKCIFV